MPNAMYRAIVGPIAPLKKYEDTPEQYRQTLPAPLAPQVQGSAPSEPREAEQPITEDPESVPNPL